MAAVQLVAAIGADEQQALVAQAAQQRGRGTRAWSDRPSAGPRSRRATGSFGGQPVEQPAQQPEQAGLRERVAGVAVAIAPAGAAAPQLGHEPRQLVARRARRASSKASGSSSRASRRRRRGDRRVGQLAGAEGRAFAAHHARAAIGGAPLELAQQPRLADAGLAGSRTRRRPRRARPARARPRGARAPRRARRTPGSRRAVARGDYLRPPRVSARMLTPTARASRRLTVHRLGGEHRHARHAVLLRGGAGARREEAVGLLARTVPTRRPAASMAPR